MHAFNTIINANTNTSNDQDHKVDIKLTKMKKREGYNKVSIIFHTPDSPKTCKNIQKHVKTSDKNLQKSLKNLQKTSQYTSKTCKNIRQISTIMSDKNLQKSLENFQKTSQINPKTS